jgi:putative methyltransferase (TIGR04325 family)
MPSAFQLFQKVLPADWWRYCRGVYPTYGEALAAIPSRKRVGFDHREIAKVFLVERLKPSDYAALYWFSRILPTIHSVFDFGGNLAAAYINYRPYLTYPADFRWVVCEVPAVAKAGEEFARANQLSQVGFTTELSQAASFDVLHSAGTLQFLEDDFAARLAPLPRKPPHLLINRIPLTEGPAFFTVQDSEHTCVPYRVANRIEFTSALERLGYRVVDSWRCAESWCAVRFRRSKTIRQYSGYYFQHESLPNGGSDDSQPGTAARDRLC